MSSPISRSIKSVHRPAALGDRKPPGWLKFR